MHFDSLAEGFSVVLLPLVDLQMLDQGLEVAVHLPLLDDHFGVERKQALGDVHSCVGPQETIEIGQFRSLQLKADLKVGGSGRGTNATGEGGAPAAHEGTPGTEIGYP